jgi:hypothetical protein
MKLGPRFLLNQRAPNLTFDITPGDIHVSPGNDAVLRPVIHVIAASSGPKGAETTETTQTETETSTSNS